MQKQYLVSEMNEEQLKRYNDQFILWLDQKETQLRYHFQATVADKKLTNPSSKRKLEQFLTDLATLKRLHTVVGSKLGQAIDPALLATIDYVLCTHLYPSNGGRRIMLAMRNRMTKQTWVEQPLKPQQTEAKNWNQVKRSYYPLFQEEFISFEELEKQSSGKVKVKKAS